MEDLGALPLSCTLFVGHFSPLKEKLGSASSAAGNEVQRSIIKELGEQCGEQNVIALSMSPHPAWPRGKLIVPAAREGDIEFPAYINIPLLKHIIFSFFISSKIILYKPSLILQYNSYFFENIFIYILSRISKSNTAAYIQDINLGTSKSISMTSLLERWSISIAKRFDLLVPISEAIIEDFKLRRENSIIFQGAPTEVGSKLMRCGWEQLDEIAVYAGALSRHNGVDRLVQEWIRQKLPWTVHIFGRGELEDFVRQAEIDGDGKVSYHGYRSTDHLLEWQSRARWNICLRYSEGIHQEYFFPSKFFNICCAPGSVVVNEFHGIPDIIRKYLIILPFDLSCMLNSLDADRHSKLGVTTSRRRQTIRSHFSWKASVAGVLNFFARQDVKENDI